MSHLFPCLQQFCSSFVLLTQLPGAAVTAPSSSYNQPRVFPSLSLPGAAFPHASPQPAWFVFGLCRTSPDSCTCSQHPHLADLAPEQLLWPANPAGTPAPVWEEAAGHGTAGDTHSDALREPLQPLAGTGDAPDAASTRLLSAGSAPSPPCGSALSAKDTVS